MMIRSDYAEKDDNQFICSGAASVFLSESPTLR